MLATKGKHLVIARMRIRPVRQVMGMQIVFVVLAKFLETRSSHIDELDLHFGGGQAILAALNDILFAATSGLDHLVNGPIAVRRKKPFTKSDSELVESVRFLVEVQCSPIGFIAEHFVGGHLVRSHCR